MFRLYTAVEQAGTNRSVKTFTRNVFKAGHFCSETKKRTWRFSLAMVMGKRIESFFFFFFFEIISNMNEKCRECNGIEITSAKTESVSSMEC